MTEPKVIVGKGRKRERPRQVAPSPEVAWKWIGWLGFVLTVAGVSDTMLAWFPAAFGNPQWEFATVVQTFSGLPLLTMGFAGLLGAGLALGRRWLIAVVGLVLVLVSLGLLAALLVFLTDVPMALRAAEGIAAVGVKKAVVKTLVLGAVFEAAYIAGAVSAFRHLKAKGIPDA